SRRSGGPASAAATASRRLSCGRRARAAPRFGRRTARTRAFRRRTTAAFAAARAAAARRGPHRDRFRLAAEGEPDAAGLIELDHVARSLIDHPDVVLRIDLHRLGEVEAVDTLADLADELAALIELEQARARLVEGPRRSDRRVGGAGARVDEDVPL